MKQPKKRVIYQPQRQIIKEQRAERKVFHYFLRSIYLIDWVYKVDVFPFTTRKMEYVAVFRTKASFI